MSSHTASSNDIEIMMMVTAYRHVSRDRVVGLGCW